MEILFIIIVIAANILPKLLKGDSSEEAPLPKSTSGKKSLKEMMDEIFIEQNPPEATPRIITPRKEIKPPKKQVQIAVERELETEEIEYESVKKSSETDILRKAIVLSEIIAPPLSLRNPKEDL